MWISEIRLKNFRPFYKENKITFQKESQNKFTIIEAKSDTGKTTFVSAISWCLYGTEFEEVNEKYLNPFNLARKDELGDDDGDEMSVEISLNEEGKDVPSYIIKRKVRCIRKGNKARFDGDSYLTIEEWENNNSRLLESEYEAPRMLNSLLPKDIHPFFLFEGEKLEKYFSLSNKENVKHAIEKTSQLKQIKNAIEHLEVVRDKIFSEKKTDKGDDYERNLKFIEEDKERIKEMEGRKGRLTSQLSQAEKRIREIDEKLSKVNIPLIKEFVEKRKELEDKNDSLNKDMESLKSEMVDSLLSNAPISICWKPIRYLLKDIEKAKKNDQLPPKIRNIYLRELLDKKICICRRSLEPKDKKASESINQIKKMLQQGDLSEMEERLTEGRFKIKDLLQNLPKKIIEERNENIKDYNSKENEIKKSVKNNICFK